MTSNRQLTIGLVQMNSRDDVTKNIQDALAGIDEAANRGAHLVCLPEVWPFLGADAAPTTIGESIPGELTKRLGERAQEHNIWLHAGSIYETVDGDERMANTAVVFNPAGALIAKYQKIHLFDVELEGEMSFCESATIKPGESVVTFDMHGVTVGLATCYDLRFPELFRALAERGSELVVLPAAFTMQTGRDHWETLIRARAIENTLFMAATGQVGSYAEGRRSFGRSMVVDPWGTVVAQASDVPGVTICTIDLDDVGRIRRQIPSLKNRRMDIVGK